MNNTATAPDAAVVPAPTSGYTPRASDREPRAVILVEPDQVQLGDVLVDAFGGQMHVEEIVHRGHEPRYEFACFRPRASYSDPLVVARRRTVVRPGVLLRVAREIDRFGPVGGHHSRVRSHNPVQRGCYTHVDGWRTQCSCGWPGDEPQIHGSKDRARAAWLTHKADIITREACDGRPGYLHVAAAEAAHRLPPVPWGFATHNGCAGASLDALTLAEARQVAAAWADALGVGVDEHLTHDQDMILLCVELPEADSYGGALQKIVVIYGYFPAKYRLGAA